MLRQRSLRRRLTGTATVAVALAVTLACGVAYLAVRRELRGEIDRQLQLQSRAIAALEARIDPPPRPAASRLPELRPQEGGPGSYVQFLDRDGERVTAGPRARYDLAVDAVDRRIAAGPGAERALRDVRDGAVHLRMLTVATDRGAIQLARPLNGVDSVLSRLRALMLGIVLGGVALAAVAGRFVTRRVTQPLRDVAEAAEHIAATDDLERRLRVGTDDEVGRLADRFNHMLDRLQVSRTELAASAESQRQLVADASHELRTPITSLRTNIEVLLDGEALRPQQRRALLADVRDELAELSALVGDIIELARGDRGLASVEEVRLDALVEESIGWARRHYPSLTFRLDAEPVVAEGDPERLARAVTNLLDNAGKHSRAGQEVSVVVGSEGVAIRDHGPGIPADDLPHIFDRFYRGATARAVAGTGLGLAIVRQVAESHGGGVRASNADGGGARFELALPVRA